MEALIHEWQLTSFAEGGAMQFARTPETCPDCGSDRVARILWGWFCPTPRQRREVEAGRAILGRWRRDSARLIPGTVDDLHQTLEVPEWVCLNCQPGWADIHRLAIKVDELQLAKEQALEAHEFELAAAYLNQQQKIDDRITESVRELKDGEPSV
jgi:hypothetical protein